MANRERNKKILLDMVKDDCCADCGAPEPDWASYKLGIFVCVNCSGVHRDLPAISRIKSLRLDFWDDALVEFMKARGNAAAKAVFEKSIPSYYYRPQQHDCVVLKDQWIRAKYERREFTGENNILQQAYSTGIHEGTLWKKGKDNKQFLKRRFLLSVSDFSLSYFTKEDQSKGPKAVICMKDLNAVFQPEKIGHAHGLQISYLHKERTRNLFVYHDNAQTIVSWFNAIRATRFAYLKKIHTNIRDSELIPLITRRSVKEGYMEKTGPTQWEPFKKRWFSLSSMDRKLLYFKTSLDAMELGAVFIGTESDGYSVREVPQGSRGGRWRCGVTLETPDRQFVFMCEQEPEQREWIEAFRRVISQPMMPQDYTTEANMRRRT